MVNYKKAFDAFKKLSNEIQAEKNGMTNPMLSEVSSLTLEKYFNKVIALCKVYYKGDKIMLEEIGEIIGKYPYADNNYLLSALQNHIDTSILFELNEHLDSNPVIDFEEGLATVNTNSELAKYQESVRTEISKNFDHEKFSILESRNKETFNLYKSAKEKLDETQNELRDTKQKLDDAKEQLKSASEKKVDSSESDQTIQRIYVDDQRAIIKAIENTGFRPTDFERKEDGLALTLTYVGTPYRFRVTRHKTDPLSFKIQHTVFDYQNSFIDLGSPNDWFPLKDVIIHLTRFINDQLKKYLKERDSPNPWEELINKINVDNEWKIDYNNKTKYSPVEQNSIALALGEIKQLVQGMQKDHESNKLLYDQLKHITGGMEYLRTQLSEESKTNFHWMWVGFIAERLINVFKIDENIGRYLKEHISEIVTRHCGNLLEQFNNY